jgi:hypothetical protein
MGLTQLDRNLAQRVRTRKEIHFDMPRLFGNQIRRKTFASLDKCQ